MRLITPRIINEFDERQVHKYQLRAYLYQARGILGADPTGYSGEPTVLHKYLL